MDSSKFKRLHFFGIFRIVINKIIFKKCKLYILIIKIALISEIKRLFEKK